MMADINSQKQNTGLQGSCQASDSAVADSGAFLIPVGSAAADTSLDPYKANAVAELRLCRYKSWSWLNEQTGEIRDFNCGSWRCPVCSQKVAWRWACRVAKALPERMVTLTSLSYDKARVYEAVGNLITDIRQRYKFEYTRFLAQGEETGMLHMHFAQKGSYIPQRFLSQRARSHGLGRVVDIRACYGAGPQFYLTDYITRESAPEGWRKVSVSRGFPKVEPVESSGEWILRKGVIVND